MVVSERGFACTAKRYAEKNGIKLLTFGDAQSENWSKTFNRLKDLKIYSRCYVLRSVTMLIRADKMDLGFVADSSVYTFDGGERVPLMRFAGKHFQDSGVTRIAVKELIENESRPDPWIEVCFDIGAGAEFFDSEGRVARPHGLLVKMGYHSRYRDLNMQNISYDGQDLAVGGFYDGLNADSAHVAISAHEGELSATIEVSNTFTSIA